MKLVAPERYQALLMHPEDDVATAIDDLPAGTTVSVCGWDRKIHRFEVAEHIPFGHKFAIRRIDTGRHILKYGESIGVASTDIADGGLVHVHNVESQRGRGDRAMERQ